MTKTPLLSYIIYCVALIICTRLTSSTGTSSPPTFLSTQTAELKFVTLVWLGLCPRAGSSPARREITTKRWMEMINQLVSIQEAPSLHLACQAMKRSPLLKIWSANGPRLKLNKRGSSLSSSPLDGTDHQRWFSTRSSTILKLICGQLAAFLRKLLKLQIRIYKTDNPWTIWLFSKEILAIRTRHAQRLKWSIQAKTSFPPTTSWSRYSRCSAIKIQRAPLLFRMKMR